MHSLNGKHRKMVTLSLQIFEIRSKSEILTFDHVGIGKNVVEFALGLAFDDS